DRGAGASPARRATLFFANTLNTARFYILQPAQAGADAFLERRAAVELHAVGVADVLQDLRFGLCTLLVVLLARQHLEVDASALLGARHPLHHRLRLVEREVADDNYLDRSLKIVD